MLKMCFPSRRLLILENSQFLMLWHELQVSSWCNSQHKPQLVSSADGTMNRVSENQESGSHLTFYPAQVYATTT